MMKKNPIYSQSPSRQETPPPLQKGGFSMNTWGVWVQKSRRLHPGVYFIAGIAVCALLLMSRYAVLPKVPTLTQEMIDDAVLKTLNTKDLPSKTTKAAQAIMPSVVLIKAYGNPSVEKKKKGTPEDKREKEENVALGTGVVIMEDGTLLTNYHVIAGSIRVEVVFYDGSVSKATIAAVHPHNDLAILKPEKLPDDLIPATLGSSANLRFGDDVVAVGFPFGIGPSVTAGVVSGLRREFTGENGALLRNLIQFDAAINQGNSGGPLINTAGEVVGIVTALLNPSETEKTFIGIGFAVTIESAGSAVGIPPF